MATLLELSTLSANDPAGDTLRTKITGALLIAAQSIVANASATAAQKSWARECLEEPTKFRQQAFNAVLASNNTATVAQLSGATDAQVQTAVNAALPVLKG